MAERQAGHQRGIRLVVILAAVLALKSLILFQLHGHVLLRPQASPDSAAYVELAQRVVAGDLTLGPGLYYVSPLYIYYLATALGLTGSLLVAKLGQILLGTLAVACIWYATSVWFNRTAAWWSAGAAALTGLFTFYEVTLLQASLDIFLTSAFLAALARGVTQANSRWVAASGVFAALLTLNRPNALLPVIVILLLLLMVRRWRFAVLVAAGLTVGLLPILVRNVVVSGQWSWSASHSGLNFFIGNAPDATGVYRVVPGIRANITGQATDARRVAETQEGRALTDSEVSSHFMRRGLSWIAEDPAAWLRLMATKSRLVLSAQHIALPLSYPFFAYDTGSALGLLFVGPWLLLPLGMLGLSTCAPRRERQSYLIWVSFAPVYLLAVVLFFVSERYRLPMLVPFAVGTGAALDRIWQTARARHWIVFSRYVGAALALGLLVNWPLGWIDGDGRFNERVHVAEVLALEGDISGSQHWAAQGLPGYPYEVEGRLRIARAHTSRANWAPAIDLLSRAHALDATNPVVGLHLASALVEVSDPAGAARVIDSLPVSGAGQADTWLALGRLAFRLDDRAKAEAFFTEAVRIAPQSAPAREQLGVILLVSGNHAGAAAHLTELIRLDPSHVDGLAHLAAALLGLGRHSEALARANAALALQPDHQLALQVRSLVRQ